MSGHPAWTNHVVEVPGTSVTAYLGQSTERPDMWMYSLWSGDVEHVASGALDLSGLVVRPDHVARVAFLLSVEYA